MVGWVLNMLTSILKTKSIRWFTTLTSKMLHNFNKPSILFKPDILFIVNEFYNVYQAFN